MKDLLPTTFEKDEQSPMIGPETPSTGNGAIDLNSDLPPRRAWFSSRFNHLYALLCALAVVMLAVLILCIVIASRLSSVESQAQAAVKQLPQHINKAVEGIKAQFPTGLFPAPFQAPMPKFEPPEGVRPITPAIHGPEERRTEAHFSDWHDSSCARKCERKDFSKPPLVILSFDGFTREYLDRGIVTTFEKVASCGATAERVIPSFPSRTFPNHYTIVTGLYPESHGIVDNYVFDVTISTNLESMKNTKYNKLWQGDPIWSVYKRQTGGNTACLFYPGCAYNASGYPPDIAPPYNKDLPFRNRFEQVREWLKQPEERRPGLITIYFDQPDTIGHYQMDDDDINQQLVELDRLLDQFLTNLNDDDILGCINLLLISDHGMQKLNKTVVFKNELNMSGLIGTPGVVGRIYINDTKRHLNEVTKPFECKNGEELRVFTRNTIPTRKHYSRTPKVGDVIIQGEAGTTFIPNEEDDYHLSADHGYDYHLSNMHTVFFGMGPSIKKKTILPAFQNIEYMNLFLDLLDLERIPNNGTKGTLDDVLNTPKSTEPSTVLPISECPLSMQFPGLRSCNNCPPEEQERMNQALWRCSTDILFFTKQMPQFASKNPVCFQNFCNKTLITGKEMDKTTVLIEDLVESDSFISADCKVTNKKYVEDKCIPVNGTTSSRRYLSANIHSEFARIASTEFNFGEGFSAKYYDVLNDLTLDYLSKFKRLTVVTGIAYDRDLDGIADASQSGSPTHLFRILISCSGVWGGNGYCQNYNDIETLAFIFPIVQNDLNCLPTNKLLLEYTARIKDIELLSGLEFVPRDVPPSLALRLRTHINLQLW